MALVGYGLDDLLPAYPGQSVEYVDALFRDNSLSLNRPVIAYGLLGISPCSSRYFNVSPHGFRSNGAAQPWPPVRERRNIFCFGGSTMLGFSVADTETIPAKLQQRLQARGVECEVYNFGSGGYKARHEALRFLDLLDRHIVPDYAVFLDGLNDAYEALGNRYLVDTLNELYQTERRRRRKPFWNAVIDAVGTVYEARRRPAPAANFTADIADAEAEAVLSEAGVMSALANADREPSTAAISPFQARLSTSVWRQYLDSTAMIGALAARHAVPILLAWQPVPFFRTTAAQRIMDRLHVIYRYGVFSKLTYEWLHLHRFPGMADDDRFTDLSELGVGLHDVLYADTVHYSPRFCEVIADALASGLLSRMARAEAASEVTRA